ncbi:hypothetical protein GCM10022252_48020 [Streptosporangium oxazolinicum]|uniref:DUF6884 domain-containing protein n=1 Tax=Streptosporangium oxazolinicum TaxID=909287 RepID=A0ABP8B4V2_9ACTN
MATDGTADELIIVGCSRRKLDTATPVAALELYLGCCFPQLRGRIASSPRHRVRVLILSALHGLITADTPLLPYDVRMTPERATELRAACTAVLADIPRSETLLLMEHGYSRALPDRAGRLIADPVGSWPEVATVLDSWGWP